MHCKPRLPAFPGPLQRDLSGEHPSTAAAPLSVHTAMEARKGYGNLVAEKEIQPGLSNQPFSLGQTLRKNNKNIITRSTKEKEWRGEQQAQQG